MCCALNLHHREHEMGVAVVRVKVSTRALCRATKENPCLSTLTQLLPASPAQHARSPQQLSTGPPQQCSPAHSRAPLQPCWPRSPAALSLEERVHAFGSGCCTRSLGRRLVGLGQRRLHPARDLRHLDLVVPASAHSWTQPSGDPARVRSHAHLPPLPAPAATGRPRQAAAHQRGRTHQTKPTSDTL